MKELFEEADILVERWTRKNQLFKDLRKNIPEKRASAKALRHKWSYTNVWGSERGHVRDGKKVGIAGSKGEIM